MNKKISGQTIVEYCVLFTVVCTVIVLIAIGPFKDNLRNMYGNFTEIFNRIRPR